MDQCFRFYRKSSLTTRRPKGRFDSPSTSRFLGNWFNGYSPFELNRLSRSLSTRPATTFNYLISEVVVRSANVAAIITGGLTSRLGFCQNQCTRSVQATANDELLKGSTVRLGNQIDVIEKTATRESARPRISGNRALFLRCTPRTDHSGNGIRGSIRASRPLQLSTSSLLPSFCPGLLDYSCTTPRIRSQD